MENENIDGKISAFINGSKNPSNNKKAAFYDRQFRKFCFNDSPLFKFSWNWASFFFGWVHLFYRKIYIPGTIFFGIYLLLIINFIKEFLNDDTSMELFGDDLKKSIVIFTVYVIIAALFCGIFNNFLIFLRYIKKTKKAKNAMPDDESGQIKYIKRIGGRNKALAILLGIIYFVMNIYIFICCAVSVSI